MGSPAIILTSKFTVPNKKDFGQYASYMARKNALEERGYLTHEEKIELEKITNGLGKLNFIIETNKVFHNSESSGVIIEARKLLERNNLATTKDYEFDKYINYMTRKGALAEKDKLTDIEKKELELLNAVTNEFEIDKVDRGKLLQGVFSSTSEEIYLNDLDSVRLNLRDGEKNGSILWQDVISFNNDFLIKHNILDPASDTLDENILRQASRNMMNKFIDKEKLNNPFWLASIHRNKEHIHIHFATVEAANSRKIEVHNGEEQPRGKRKQSTIDEMKASFTNTMLDMTPLLEKITLGRNQVRVNIQDAYKKHLERQDFKTLLNDFAKDLPDDRRKWNYGSLKKEQKQKLDIIVDSILKDDPDYQELKNNIHRYSENRNELYGKTDRESKNYERNKLVEIQKRNGNALLFALKNMDRKATFYRKKIPISPGSNPNTYIQEVLKILEDGQKSSYIHRSEKQDFKKQLKLRRPVLNRARVNKIVRIFDKQTISLEKRRALQEYERMTGGTSGSVVFGDER